MTHRWGVVGESEDILKRGIWEMEGHIGPVQKSSFSLMATWLQRILGSAQKHVCRQVRRVTLGVGRFGFGGGKGT